MNEGDGFSSVIFTSLPSNGTLKINSGGVAIDQQVFFSDITKLSYVPAPDNTVTDTLTFRVQDDGGTGNGGVNTDPVPNTLTFNISPVNDAPVASGIEPLPLV